MTSPPDAGGSEAEGVASRARLSSLLERLKNRARALGLPRDAMLTLYFHEAVLARLSRSAEREHYVLKGGLRLYGHYGNAARPTVDIDLARLRPLPSTQEVHRAFSELLSVPLESLERSESSESPGNRWPGDGVQFDTTAMTISAIMEGAGAGGVRLEVEARFERATQKLQIDFSFAPPIRPAPQLHPFPSLLTLQNHPLLMVPLETVVADKLAAAVENGSTNTRLKDFYDLLTILGSADWTPEALREALEHIFAARGTPLTGTLDLLERLGEDVSLQARWTAFLRRNTLTAPASFAEVLLRIGSLLKGVLEGD